MHPLLSIPIARDTCEAWCQWTKTQYWPCQDNRRSMPRALPKQKLLVLMMSVRRSFWATILLKPKAQGYEIDETEVFQDNISSIYLLVNGQQSSSKRTKHMNVWYFFMKDHIKNREMRIKHCPTKQMLADPFTTSNKPRQGSEFREFRAGIMNIDPTIPDYEMFWDRVSLPKTTNHRPHECVGVDSFLENAPCGAHAAASA